LKEGFDAWRLGFSWQPGHSGKDSSVGIGFAHSANDQNVFKRWGFLIGQS
jgi:hypothetical protein